MDRGLGASPCDIDRLPPTAETAASSVPAMSELVRAEVPLVIRGLVGPWPVVEAGRAGPAALTAYLKRLDVGASAPLMETPAGQGGRFAYGADPSEFSFSRRQRPVAASLDHVVALADRRDGPVAAIQMLRLDQAMPAFAGENPMPLLPPRVAPRLWAGGPVRTQTHNDRDHNLACVVTGARRFVLFPPHVVADLYVGPLDNPPPLSLVDPEAPDLARFPRYARAFAQGQVAWLEPGDALFLPKHWWHHVASLSPYNAMVNYWWGDDAVGLDSPSDLFLAALLALKDLPPGERSYWRAMFEAHVFGDGEASAHVPERLRGALGRLAPAQRASLRKALRASILRTLA